MSEDERITATELNEQWPCTIYESNWYKETQAELTAQLSRFVDKYMNDPESTAPERTITNEEDLLALVQECWRNGEEPSFETAQDAPSPDSTATGEFETSSPLRDENAPRDDWGAEFDPGEMGTAEVWWRKYQEGGQ